MDIIKTKCPAKINLALDVIRKRDDGYHDVDMIMQSVPLYDMISVERTQTEEINISTDCKGLCTDDRNIAYKAAEMFLSELDIKSGLSIHIQKNIPIGAGLAGGSADAAGVLRVINQMFDAKLTQEELMKFGEGLGADVPFCVMNSGEVGVCARAEGIGTRLERINSKLNLYYVLAKPKFSVSTAWVYNNLRLSDIKSRPSITQVISGIESGNVEMVSKDTGNVLESVTVIKYPIIEEYKKIFTDNGAVFSLMSGSGPTVFGAFCDNKDARNAYNNIKKRAGVCWLFCGDTIN